MKTLVYVLTLGLAGFFVAAFMYAVYEVAMSLHEHGLRGVVMQFWCGQVGCKQ